VVDKTGIIMKAKLIHCCSDMSRTLNEKRAYIGYAPKVREYYLNSRNDPIVYLISYCPWCSNKLPISLRDKWFDILELEHNLDDPWDKKQEKLIPKEFQSNEWWIRRGL
jgi:hypothetical protein